MSNFEGFDLLYKIGGLRDFQLYTLGMIDFKPLRKFNGCNFHIFFTVFDVINFSKKIFDLAKCPFL